MRIIHIVHGKCNPNEHNGISRVVYYLNKHEKLQGINSEIWAVVDDAKTKYQKIRDEYVTVECYPRVKVPFGKHEIIEDLKKEKDTIDLVHFHMIWFYDKNIIANELCRLGIPYIITTHGTYSKKNRSVGKKRIAQALYEVDYLNKAKEIHILTREEGTYLESYGYKGKSFVGYNGIEPEELPEVCNNNLFNGKPYSNKIKIGWVGVFRDDKNLDSLVEAVSMLNKEIKNKIVFILVGPDKNQNAKRYLAYAKKLGCRNCFDWVGPLYNQDKYDAYSSFDAYIMPSYSEGFSMAIIDAMASGKPCLLTRGCNMNYLPNCNNMFFFCEPYPQDIANGIKELVEQQFRWSDMGEAEKEFVKKELSWESIVRKMKIDYERIIDNK